MKLLIIHKIIFTFFFYSFIFNSIFKQKLRNKFQYIKYKIIIIKKYIYILLNENII